MLARPPLPFSIFFVLAVLVLPGCTQNGAEITEVGDRLTATTTGGTASAGILVMAVVVAVFGGLIVSMDAGKTRRHSKRDNVLLALFFLGMSLFSFHEGASRPVVEVDKGRREVRFRSTLLGLVVHEETLHADQITQIRSRRFTRSGKTRRGEWGSISFFKGATPVGEFEASQAFVTQAHDLAKKMGKMLDIPVEHELRGSPR